MASIQLPCAYATSTPPVRLPLQPPRRFPYMRGRRRPADTCCHAVRRLRGTRTGGRESLLTNRSRGRRRWRDRPASSLPIASTTPTPYVQGARLSTTRPHAADRHTPNSASTCASAASLFAPETVGQRPSSMAIRTAFRSGSTSASTAPGDPHRIQHTRRQTARIAPPAAAANSPARAVAAATQRLRLRRASAPACTDFRHDTNGANIRSPIANAMELVGRPDPCARPATTPTASTVSQAGPICRYSSRPRPVG